MQDHRNVIIESALRLLEKTGSEKLFLFLHSVSECRWVTKTKAPRYGICVIVIPQALDANEAELKSCGIEIIRSWSGNQTRFSRIKYAFLRGVLQGIIRADSKTVCVIGPAEKCHLDTIAVHDLAHSWSEEFPFDVGSLVSNPAFYTVMAVVDIALDIGALGREGKSVGTTFVIGDEADVLKNSHQAVFNPFRGYSRKERMITLPEVVESVKELAKLDGAIIISSGGVVEAAGRMLDARSVISKKLRGLGARHRSAAGITKITDSIAIVVSESTGRVTICEGGRIIATLEPLISKRMV